jgi:hypothetical protein
MWWEPLLGAVAGSGATAGATLVISAYLNRQRENREALVALQVVRTELEENQSRIDELDIGNKSPDITYSKIGLYTPDYLTLGDWQKNKSTVAVIALRDKALWDEIREIYRKVFEANRDKEPNRENMREFVQWLTELADKFEQIKPKLKKREQKLAKEMGLPYFITSPLRRLLAKTCLRPPSQSPSSTG